MLQGGRGEAGRHSAAHFGDQRVRSAAPGTTAAHHQPDSGQTADPSVQTPIVKHRELLATKQLEDTAVLQRHFHSNLIRTAGPADRLQPGSNQQPSTI